MVLGVAPAHSSPNVGCARLAGVLERDDFAADEQPMISFLWADFAADLVSW
jgi:hypothetical protein